MFKIVLFIFLAVALFSNECLECHKERNTQCQYSKHFTLKDPINLTRKVWGIQNSDVTLQNLPQPKTKIEKPADLVDDFLRRKCLKCHLESRVVNKTGNICLSCHNSHTNRQDKALAKPTMNKCLGCHNNQFVGWDYTGRFPHDYDKSYRSPITKEGNFPVRPYGIDNHHLSKDIHYIKGMDCTACHKGKNWEETSDCKSCHTNLSSENHKNYHDKISCSACHSSWNGSSYELNVLRDDTPNYKQWERLTVQEDTYLESFLNRALKEKTPPKPMMPDYVDNKLKEGIWYSGWKFRRWENFFLVNADDGKIKVARPMFQYRISYKDRNGNTVLDDVAKQNGEKIEAFLPYSPHTITKKAKSCEMCHENKIMLDKDLINRDLLQGKVYKGKPLSKEQLKKLTSPLYRKERAKSF